MRTRTIILKESKTCKQVFCKCYIESAILFVNIYLRRGNCKSETYFVPQNGFSINWDLKKGKQARFYQILESSKGENIVQFMVHPSVWKGIDFNHRGMPMEDIAQMCLNKLNFYWYE